VVCSSREGIGAAPGSAELAECIIIQNGLRSQQRSYVTPSRIAAFVLVHFTHVAAALTAEHEFALAPGVGLWDVVEGRAGSAMDREYGSMTAAGCTTRRAASQSHTQCTHVETAVTPDMAHVGCSVRFRLYTEPET